MKLNLTQKETNEQLISTINTVAKELTTKIENVDKKIEDKKDVERSIQLQKWLKLGGFKK